MKLKAILSGLTLVLFCAVGFSQTPYKRTPKKQFVEKRQLNKEVKPHQLSKKDAVRLKKQHQKIAQLKKAARYDGVVTKKEKKVIYNKQKAVHQRSPLRENRKMMKVTINDATEADQQFEILMGDQVEPRREFIDNNALSVSNLDI